jgi:hypothetical protein
MQDISTLQPVLKTLYPSGVPLNLVYKDHPFYAMVKKYEQFGGEDMKIPLIYGNPQGRSATFATAQANVTNAKTTAFNITRVSDYAIARITNEAIEASMGNEAAFIEGLKLEIDGAIAQAGASDAQSLFGNGSGVIGQLAASVTLASTTVQLRDPEQIVNFEVGQKIKLSSANGGGTLRAGSLTIVAVNRSAGSFTVNTNISTGVATATANDFISIEGDYDAKMKGLAAWLPLVAPTSGDSFFGVDRSVDVTRMAGQRGDLSALPVEEALIEASKLIAREGGKPDYCFMNYEEYSNLEKSLGSKVQYVDLKGPADIGFRGLLVHGHKAPIKVIADQDIPSGEMFMLQMDTWKLCSLKSAVRILDLDGNKMLRISNQDAVEIRVGGYKQLACHAPGWNGHFSI